MDPKFVKENSEIIRKNEIIRGELPDTIDMIISNYNKVIKLDFIISQLKRARNISGPLIKNQVASSQIDYTDDMWIIFMNDISDKLTTERALNSLVSLNKKGLLTILKLIKEMIIKSKYEIKELHKSISNASSNLGNIVSCHVHKFSKNINYMPVHNSPFLTATKKEPNNKFKTEWVQNKDNDEQILYISETPKHLYELQELETYYPLLSHTELTQKFNLVSYDEPTKISGNRGYAFLDLGVKLNRALMNYAIDFLSDRGYSLLETPHMMTYESLSGVTQLSDFHESLYQFGKQETDPKLIAKNKFLIATSEQPLTAFYRDKIIKSKELPIRIGGISHCYRKETGSHGIDTNGIFRVHQFQKIEQFAITNPEDSWDEMDRMIKISAEFYDTLGLKYRIIKVVTNDINKAAAMKYDLEGYFPSSKKYRELVSCTNCTNYIASRIHCRTDQQRIPHFLNSTLCANTRVICCILETYQNPKTNQINIPDILIPYLNGITVLHNNF